MVTNVPTQGPVVSRFLSKSFEAELQIQVLKIVTKAQFKDVSCVNTEENNPSYSHASMVSTLNIDYFNL